MTTTKTRLQHNNRKRAFIPLNFSYTLLERQIILGIPRQEIRSHRRSRRRNRSTLDRRRCSRRGRFHFPCPDAIEPAVLPLVGIDVERNFQLLSHLYVELRNPVRPEDFKTHPARVLPARTILDDVLLSFPLISCPIGHSPFFGKHCNDFSDKFHCSLFFVNAAKLRFFRHSRPIHVIFSSDFVYIIQI